MPQRGALRHFLAHRLNGTALPVADLYAVRHLAPYRDDAARGEDPFLHYIADAFRDGHAPLPDAAMIAASGVFDPNHYFINSTDVHERALDPVVSFDPAWYRHTYAVPAGQSALAHYLAHRRGQRVSPNAHFDVAWYLARNPLGPNRDPFAHFLRAGTYGDRDPSPDFDAAAYRKRVLGRPSRHFRHLLRPERDNPLVHWLGIQYGAAPSSLEAV